MCSYPIKKLSTGAGSSGGMFSAPPVPSSEPAAPAGDGGVADQEDEDQPPKVEIKQVVNDTL